MANTSNKINAGPSKGFFADMITRDLGISDAILDLIDNSIDHAVKRDNVDVMEIIAGGGPAARFKNAKIVLRVAQNQFAIEDTCGGIDIDDARNRVFRFGIPIGASNTTGLSVYGIGMKRAFFKLGQIIRVESATSRDWFVIDIDVEKWKARGDDDWNFEFTKTGRISSGIPAGVKPRMTTITVKGLNSDVSQRFSQTSWVKELVEKIGSTYALFLKAGANVVVNGRSISSTLPAIGDSGHLLRPARKMLNLRNVNILIIAGVTPREDRVPRGWYVFCNGRMIIGPDRSRATGWGDVLPQWHSKYSHFVGYVYFRSIDMLLLPWTTTKQAVVFESRVYQTALAEMQLQARPVINFLNNMYPGEPEPEGVIEREILEKARPIPITQLRAESSFSYDVKRKARLEEELVNIQYKKRRKDVDKIRDRVKKQKMAASKIGEYTFNYFIKRECD